MFFASAVSGIAGPTGASPVSAETEIDWPTHFHGRELTRQPLSVVEQRWLREFPGTAARFGDGEQELFMRRVERPTRALHPSADCFKGLGYSVTEAKVRDIDGERWSCFQASKAGLTRNVCERIHDETGRAWTDASSWYWSALLNRSRAPWWAITVAGPLLSAPVADDIAGERQ
jgi:hypothetical protein